MANTISDFENDLLNSPDFAAMREMLQRSAGGDGMGGSEDGGEQDDSTDLSGPMGALTSQMTGSAAPDARQSGLASLAALRQQGDETYQRLTQNLKDTYERSAQMLRERRYGPSRAQQLFAVSAALAQPTRYRGLAATMGNLTPVLAQIAEAKRTGQYEQAKALSDLAQENLTASQSLELARGKHDLGLAGLEAKYAAQGKGQTWDPQRGRWVTKGAVEVMDTGVDDQGRRVKKYSDGSISRDNPDGTVSWFDAGGDPINGR